jgi:hypothetical protein
MLEDLFLALSVACSKLLRGVSAEQLGVTMIYICTSDFNFFILPQMPKILSCRYQNENEAPG